MRILLPMHHPHPHPHPHPVREPLFTLLRAALRRADDLRVALGALVVAAAAVAALGAWAFAELAEEVREGTTQRIDESALRFLDALDWLDPVMLEITALGNGTVVLVTAGVAALFLWLTRHRYSAVLLVTATAGGMLLTFIMKGAFSRPRPQVVEWGTHVATSSFPSGHASSAAVVYLTVAYLAARLQRRRWARWLTMAIAVVLVVLIAASRLVLGVHYPSDVVAGMALGLAWAAFCMAALEAIQRLILRGEAPGEEEQEMPAPDTDGDQARDERARAEAAV
ncbi:MAG TPA: phosphatase PAP2 family protein [Gemmatimonadales bacterium]